MTERKKDLRFRRTEVAIRRSYWQLATKYGIKKITVKQLLEVANINRATFYNHYENLDAVHTAIVTELIAELRQQLDQVPIQALLNLTNHQTIHNYFTHLSTVLYAHREELTVLLAVDTDFLNQILSMDQDLWEQKHLTDFFVLPQAYISAGMTGLGLGLINQWIKSDFEISISEFVSILETMMPPLLTNRQIFSIKD
ncbi:TetR/AcrR family transcriptional regulator [Lactiplantibacillus mudanjiangensis]|uniref:TetR family transcriptional regulator [Lactobacillus curieae] n=1 Tax=Lactiplantibacillus mudanjiangensis TaxID=1296538 RepID=A0A660EBS2_9LACO|nr:TetR/AcrR family transcriptional regulator [Lactiplantibacillus mudanjiangensis]VDG20446.1 TetR family transcriptional regulator [Lactobacillus curieae] [Lactiplantibacillus mudanjiangensis]VDG25406.1 TetR family transcriptional regulator [Lactobacillus curieae] [Lactiplantibacillus mudanjiangensis]VDG30415.1 TetR family transcriptional regulator [Lactobacillus curieae] [Lactiplantibacillus mudanjiangensis]VDG30803.1 TetR family transcriptional regulator [Lactobacillus curieae] [Lactiplantib